MDCLADALDNRIESGVWGGMTERERRALLRRHPNVTSWRRTFAAAMRDRRLDSEHSQGDSIESAPLAAINSTVEQERPARSAECLLAVTVLVLPAQDRARWREEFTSELYDLAADTPRWRQVAYVLRLFNRAWELRAAVRAPVRRKAGS